MDFHLSLSSIIIILFLSFLLTILPPSFCQEDDRFVVCNRTHACGSVNISFPFSGGSRPDYCGHPGYGLTCHENEYPVLVFEGIESVVFRVLNISTSSQILTIARSDLLADRCAPKYQNTTLNYTLFDYASTVVNITIFYGCPDLQDIRNRSLNCSQGVPGGNINAYYLEDKSPLGAQFSTRLTTDCDHHTRVPILQSSASALLNDAQAIEDAIDEGFEVEYSSELAIHCWVCEDSGGVCGSNSTTGAFVCYCRNKEEPYTCPKPGKTSWKIKLTLISGTSAMTGVLMVTLICCYKRKLSTSKIICFWKKESQNC